jgi:acyl transferase domain-containing protein
MDKIPGSRFEIKPSTCKVTEESKENPPAPTMGNLLENSPFDFDHEFFNISPREATSMDPQQKLVLQGAKLALDDAGFVANSTPSSQCDTTACFIGAATDDYVQNLSSHVDVYYSTGMFPSHESQLHDKINVGTTRYTKSVPERENLLRFWIYWTINDG